MCHQCLISCKMIWTISSSGSHVYENTAEGSRQKLGMQNLQRINSLVELIDCISRHIWRNCLNRFCFATNCRQRTCIFFGLYSRLHEVRDVFFFFFFLWNLWTRKVNESLRISVWNIEKLGGCQIFSLLQKKEVSVSPMYICSFLYVLL